MRVAACLQPLSRYTSASYAMRCFSSSAAHMADRQKVQPTELVPDVQTFLTKIGRNMVQYADQFESWDGLVRVTSAELKEKGIDTRDRRYLLGWLERYSNGVVPCEYKRGTKSWGGERKSRAERAAHYGRKHAEERGSA